MNNRGAHHSASDSAGAADGGVQRTVLDWPQHAGMIDQMLPVIEQRVRRRRQRRLGAVAAGLAAMLVIVLIWPDRENGRVETKAAVAGGPLVLPMTQVLSDGSVVQLREGAEIAVDFDEGHRRVVLKKGEAHFQVTKNPRRPFIVVAGGVEVRAVGTAFRVQLGGRSVDVLVTEGRVAVDHGVAAANDESPAPAPLVVLDAGNQVTIGTQPEPQAKPEVTPLTPEELEAQLAWRVPRLDLSSTPLEEVISLFNQYGRARLALGDPALGKLRISGVLRVDHPELLVRLLERAFGIRAEQRGGDEIVFFKAR